MSEANSPQAFRRRIPLDESIVRLGVGTLAAGSILSLGYVQYKFGAGPLPIIAAATTVAGLLLTFNILKKQSPVRIIALAAALGFVLRTLTAVWLDEVRFSADPLSYLTLSQSLLEGKGLNAWGHRAHYPPLYPLLLGAARAVIADQTIAISVLNAAIDSAGAVALFLLGRTMLGERTGALAAAAWLLWPPLVLSGPVPQKEGLAVTLFLWPLLFLMKWAESRRWGFAALAGSMWGLLALAQPGLALVGPFLFAGTVAVTRMPLRDSAQALAIVAVSAVLVLSPWWLRNYLVFGEFVPFTTIGGLAFTRLVPPEVLQLNYATSSMTDVQMGAATWHQATTWIFDHPLDYLENVLIRGARAMLLEISPAQRLQWFYPAPKPGMIVFWMLLCQIWFSVLLLHAMKALLDWKRTPGGRLLLVLVLDSIAQLVCVGIWFQFYDRHRQYLTPLIMLVAFSSVTRPAHERRVVSEH